MFSKKTLQITLAFVLLIGLAAIGLVYGSWTETLNVNGTVSTGTFDVVMDYMYLDWDAGPGCAAVISPDGNTLTVTIDNAYPGYHCGGGVTIKNLSSIPAKYNGLVELTNNVPAAFRGGAGLVFENGTGAIIPAHSNGGGVMWDFTMPAGETGYQDKQFSFSYSFLAEQAVP